MEKAGTMKAKNFMISLVYGRTVYLDIDDLCRTDNWADLFTLSTLNITQPTTRVLTKHCKSKA